MENTYEMVGGLEIHVRLKSKTKLFCNCSNDTFNKEANTLICPVCSGFPGTLPVLNQSALKMAQKTALALKCKLLPYSKFDRKSYFYPDLPSGFQISQFDEPVAEKGEVDVLIEKKKKTFRINRAHLENDAGKLMHEGAHSSLVDLNRAGSPLLEIVTEPDFRSPDEVFEFLKELQKIMRYLGTSDADMEKGMMRCDANISIRKKGAKEFGTKVEIKNMNSFANVKKAMEYEIKRQKKALENGEKIIQETRGWDADKEKSISQRTKEESADYRYFPEPDLPPIETTDQEVETIKKELPELPATKTLRFIEEHALPFAQAVVLTSEKQLADFFEETVKITKSPQKTANWIIGDYLALLKENPNCQLSAENLGKLIALVEAGEISNKIAKEIFPTIAGDNLDPEKYIEEKGLVQISDQGEIEKFCQEVISENAQIAEDYKGGKDRALGALVGKVMQKSKGQANPKAVNEILKKLLS